MKDIYETLNDINFDTSEYEKLDVKISEVSKKRLKKKVGKEINVQYSRRYKTLASICKIGVVVILLLGTMGITNQTIAKTISNTIKYFQESIFYNREYEKYSKGMDLISRDNKISIKLNSVVYDGSSLYLAYEVSTETPLKYGVKIWSSDITINGNKINGNKKISIDGREFQDDIFRNCDYLVEKDSDNEKYVVTTRWDLTDYKLDNKSEVSIEWNINNIHGIDGKWSFKFKVLKEELMDKTKTFKNIGEVSFNDHQKFKIDKVTINPLETRMELTEVVDKIKSEEYLNKKGIKASEEMYSFNYLGACTDFAQDNLIIADNNEELFAFGGEGQGYDNKAGFQTMRRSYDFTSISQIPKELKIIPVKKKIKSEDEERKFIKIKDLRGGMELLQGKDKSLLINSVDKSDGNLKLNISFKGMDIKRRAIMLLVVPNYDKYLLDPENYDGVKFSPNTFEGLKNYNLKGSIDLLFEGVDEEAYLSYEDYDATYTVEMENVKIIKLN